MMTTEEAFFQAILAEPDEDAHRLIFADWLEEQGDAVRSARAEFIRLQMEMSRLVRDTPVWQKLAAREQELLSLYRRAWNGPLHERLHRGGLVGAVKVRRGLIKPWVYRRGFVEGLHLTAQMFLKHGPLLFQIGPIRHVKLWGAHLHVQQLAQCPLLARLVTLDLSQNRLTDAHARILAASPHLGNLAQLYLTDNPIGTSGRSDIKHAPALASTHVHYTGWASEIFPPFRRPAEVG